MREQNLKVLLIGLDGVNFDLISRLLPRSVMPTLNSLIAEGVSGNLKSVFPTHSASAWSSFMTGTNPSAHGVFDFKMRLPDGRYRHAKPDISNVLWHIIGNYGYKVGIFNFPVTFPPDVVNGWIVSGMLSPELERATYPPLLGVELRKVFPDYLLDIEWMLYENRPVDLLNDLIAMVIQNTQVAQYLLNREAVDCFFMAFIATDRAQHALWQFMDPLHPNYQADRADEIQPLIYHFYEVLDESIKALVEFCDDETVLILLSDHGFQSAAWQFHVNEWLANQHWLIFQERSERFTRWIRKVEPPPIRIIRRKIFPDVSRHFSSFAPGGTINWDKTLAYCPWNFHQGIQINPHYLAAKRLSKESREFNQLITEISKGLTKIRNPHNNEKVIKKVYRVAEIYQGDYLNQMPDLVFELNPNYAPGIHRQRLFEHTHWASGDHNLEGFITIYQREITADKLGYTQLIDVAPTILRLLRLPIPSFMQGHPLPIDIKIPMQDDSPIMPQKRLEQSPLDQGTLSDDDEKKLLEQLKNLGYL